MADHIDADAFIRGTGRLDRSSGWKQSAQRFLLNRLTEISILQKAVQDGVYQPDKGGKFRIRENGHERIIHAMTPRDAVLQHVLADEILIPTLRRYLIYDNGASLKGKGISFTRRRFEEHLRWHYRRYGTDGYILLIDFRKYFDNIRHDNALRLVGEKIHDDMVMDIMRRIFKTYEVDISYSDDKDIERKVFNSLEYQRIDKDLLIGRRYMRKSISIGSQISQIIGVFYPTLIDTYCKTVKRIHCYDAYMDDRIIIHPNKNFLRCLLKDIEQIAGSLGIFINHRKTQIIKLSHGFTWLKTRYILTNTGKIIRKLPRDAIRREKRRIKKIMQLVEAGKMTEEQARMQYKSWRGDKKRYHAHRTLRNMDKLFSEEMKKHGRKCKKDTGNPDGNPAAEKSVERRYIRHRRL